MEKKGNNYKKIEYLENEKSFLDETKNHLFIVFTGLSVGEKILKNDKKQWTQALKIKPSCQTLSKALKTTLYHLVDCNQNFYEFCA